MSSIHVSNLAKTFRVADKKPGFVGNVRHFAKRKTRDIDAVRGVSFDIQPGEMVGFLGPNGAGKTTTLKMLTGLIHPTGGTVEVLGHTPARRQAAFLRDITLVMGNKQQMIWDLPPMDSFQLNAAVYSIPPAEVQPRIDELAGMLELDEELTQPVRKLSLGQRMKCELVAALLHHPRVLFLDEPTLGLDVNAQVAVRQFLQAYNRKHDATVLLTSHYMADITALCDRVIVIHRGTLLYDGTLSGVIERFAPFRELKVELRDDADRGRLEAYGEIESCEGRAVRLLVLREALTATVQRLLEQERVVDLTVTDPPIEDIIGRLFQSGNEDKDKEKDKAKTEEEAGNGVAV